MVGASIGRRHNAADAGVFHALKSSMLRPMAVVGPEHDFMGALSA
jgi:hypothetical protein